MRLIDSCVTQLEDQGPSRTCNESKEKEEVVEENLGVDASDDDPPRVSSSLLLSSLELSDTKVYEP